MSSNGCGTNGLIIDSVLFLTGQFNIYFLIYLLIYFSFLFQFVLFFVF